MPTKSEPRKPRTKVKNISSKAKELSHSEQKRVKGGARYIEQDNLYKSRADASLVADAADSSLMEGASIARAQDA